MLHLQAGQITTITLTLTEHINTEVGAYAFLFIATSRSTNEQVSFTIDPASDSSAAPARYNSFDIDGSLFDNSPPGQWNYEVHQVRPGKTQSLALLETGLMQLHTTTD